MSGLELFGHVQGRVEMLRSSMTAIMPDVMSEGVDRWILASLLQESIRRGKSELALGAALKLLETDPPRLWRRLMTIGLEDIGVGDLDTALDLVAVSTSHRARRLLGGAQASLEIVIPLACRAVKDRTADHLASLVRWEGQKDTKAEISRSGPSFLPASRSPEISPPPSASWLGRVYGAFALAGAWERGKLELEEVLNHFGRAGAPGALLEACGHYGRRCGDTLFIHALIGWAIWKKEAPESLALARGALSGRDLDGLPDYGLDPLRTRLGRRAIELWLRSYLEKVPFDTRQVMAGLWNAEAALCNQTLFWKSGCEIQKAAYQADLLARGLSLERQEELLIWIAQESSVLFSARQMVWQSHVRAVRETSKTQETNGDAWQDHAGSRMNSGSSSDNHILSHGPIRNKDLDRAQS